MENTDAQTIIAAMESKKKIRGVAKKFTLIILGISFIVGIAGAAKWLGENFDMTGYIEFLKAFSFLFIPLILSIGADSIMKKTKEKDKEIAKEITKGEKE